MKLLQEGVKRSQEGLGELSDHNTRLTPNERQREGKLDGCTLDCNPVWQNCQGALSQSHLSEEPISQQWAFLSVPAALAGSSQGEHGLLGNIQMDFRVSSWGLRQLHPL